MSKIVVVSSLVFLALIPSAALAQITPDSSLGAENSVVDTNGNRDTIKGGAIRDANLFHSFQEFNVEALRSAYFTNPDGIANIFSRVTGNNLSNIQGVLGVLGDANLYLINPNGILFGENARLDVNGSFLATTADSVLFENGFEFSTANPDAPPLLTIDIPIGLRFRDNPGDIVNQSTANNGNGLEVSVGENITLVGGDIDLEGGNIWAPGGRVELGGLSAAGAVTINDNGSLSFPEDVERADVTLTNGAEVNVRADGGGSINVNARNLELSGREEDSSSLLAGIAADSDSPQAQAGDITLNVTDTINVSQDSGIANDVEEFGVGNSGSIVITSTDLFLKEGSQISTSTFGLGNSGAININAEGSISASGENSEGLSGGILSIVGSTAEGNSGGINLTTTDLSVTNSGIVGTATFGRGDGGGINLTTTDLSLTNGGQVDASTFGVGNTGGININVLGTISASGEDTEGFSSGIFSNVQGEGNSGGINLTTTDLSLNNGGQLSASTFGIGDGGAISIDAQGNISVDGQGPSGRSSGIFSTLGSQADGNSGGINLTTTDLSLTNGGQVDASTFFATGDGGNIEINTGSLSITGGAFIDTSTFLSTGDGGNIEINTGSLSITGGAFIDTSTSFSRGDGGKITINASELVSLGNEESNGRLSSNVGFGAIGNSGGVEINTGSLSVNNSSQIESQVQGQGNSGKIIINAQDTVSFDGRDSTDTIPSAAFSRVLEGGEGNSGGIEINANSLSLTNRAQLSSSLAGVGEAGDIIINTNEEVLLSNSLIASEVSGEVSDLGRVVGDGGDIIITTGSLLLQDGSALLADTENEGNAGNINIEARERVVLEGEGPSAVPGSLEEGLIVPNQITATVDNFVGAIGKGGNIEISTPFLSVTDGGFIRATTFAQGNAGNLTIETERLSLRDGGTISASTNGFGNAGNLVVKARELIEIFGVAPEPEDGSSFLGSEVESQGRGVGGNVTIETRELIVRERGQISVSTEGFGNAGNLTIRATNSILLRGEDSGLFAEAAPEAQGQGGSINVQTGSLSLSDGAQVSAATAFGEGGNITLTINDNLTLRNNSQISAEATNNANGGNVNIDAQVIVAFPNQNNDIIASASQGQGGEINITTEGIFGLEERSSTPTNETNDIDASSEFGLDGQINITRPDVDPTSGLLELTQEVVDPAKLIAQNVCTQTADSEFVDLGQGGLPQNPQDRLAEDTIEVGLVAPIITSSEATEPTRTRIEIKPKRTRKPPAQGWIFHDNGIVELVAYNPNRVGEQRTWDNHRGCQN